MPRSGSTPSGRAETGPRRTPPVTHQTRSRLNEDRIELSLPGAAIAEITASYLAYAGTTLTFSARGSAREATARVELAAEQCFSSYLERGSLGHRSPLCVEADGLTQ